MDSDSDDASLEDEEAVGGRSRDLLSSFYGKMASDVAPPEEEEDEALDPIDREDFDADAHVRGLLKTEPLPKLLERDDALCREVKSLSGDMQMLVYENYSKFIGATDTIRDMKENVGGMEGEMTSLSAAMADIDATSAKVNASLADKRSQIDKLVRARRLLKRLEFLFELPKKLAAAIADGRHGEAVTSFQAVDGVLRKYAHVPSLADIHAESAAIVAGLRDTLLEELARPPAAGAPSLAAAEGGVLARVVLLGDLGADAAASEAAAFACVDRHVAAAVDGAALDGAATLEGRVAALTAAFVGPYGAGAAQLAKVAELTDARLAGVAPAGPRPSLDQSRADLVAKYVLRLERVLAAAEGTGPPTAEAAAALAAALAAAVDGASRGAGDDGLGARVAAVAARAAAAAADGAFAGARRAAADAVARLPGAVSRGDAAALDAEPKKTAELVRGAVAEALALAEPLAPFLGAGDAAADRERRYYAWVRDALESLGGVAAGPAPSAVAGDGDPPAGRPEIRDAPRPFAGLAASAGAEPPEPPAGADAAKNGAVALAALCRLLGDASPGYGELATALLAAHVDLVHGDVSRRVLDALDADALAAAVAAAAATAAPRHTDAVAACVALVAAAGRRVRAAARNPGDAPLDDADAADDDAAAAAAAATTRMAAPRAPTQAGKRGGGIELDVERLFTSKAAPKAAAAADDPASPAGVRAALLRRLARALLDAVRDATLSRPQYAQLERDARYLHAVLPSHVPDADARRAIELAVADFLQGASDRCLD